MMKPRIGILEVGRTPDELIDRYPSYAQMCADWLAPLKGEVTNYPIMDGAALPSVGDADLWVITGSRVGVYEPHPWIEPLKRFIVDAKAHGHTKMLGICFGHQIMAQALGGDVKKSDKGWGVGLHSYEVNKKTLDSTDVLASLPMGFSINAYHQDQILQAPPLAEHVASSKFCEFASLHYPGFGLSFQGHPEFDPTYEADLIALRLKTGHLTKELAQKGSDSLEGQNTRLALREWFIANWRLI